MIEKNIVVTFSKGLHARPAASLVQMLSGYKSNVKIVREDMEIDAKSIMGILILAAGCGTELNMIIEGSDEQEVAQALEKFFSSKYEDGENGSTK
ncbi:MAG: HPr family phosphocarrier protein [Elusimicrobiota bacterium]|nr:HPr family phosphocarrier protein [Elusimicrobiota bacterium]